MSYLNETLKRANIKSIREYLMYGDKVIENTESYEQRLKQVHNECMQMILKYDSKGEESELFKVINSMTSEHEDVYMEIGMQAGFRLATDILQGNTLEDNVLLKYKEMYVRLFKDISMAIETLKEAQQRAEETYISIE